MLVCICTSCCFLHVDANKEPLVHQPVLHCCSSELAVMNSGVQSTVLSEVSGLGHMLALPVFHIDTLLDKTEDAPEL